MANCYLCGTKLIRKVNWTKDHIPPKCFFPPSTQNMITVPCCKPHNEEYKPLDDKIRNHMASLITIPSKPIEKGHRAVLESPKLAREYLSYTKKHPSLVGKDGKARLIYYFDKEELNEWLTRIVKGLFFNENKSRINENAIFEGKARPEIYPPSSSSFPMEKSLERRPYFVYSFLKDVAPNKDFWLLIFYDRLLFSVEVDFPI